MGLVKTIIHMFTMYCVINRTLEVHLASVSLMLTALDFTTAHGQVTICLIFLWEFLFIGFSSTCRTKHCFASFLSLAALGKKLGVDLFYGTLNFIFNLPWRIHMMEMWSRLFI